MNSALQEKAATTAESQQEDADNIDSGTQALFSTKQFEFAYIQMV